MRRVTSISPVRAALLPLALIATLAGCYNWQTVPSPYERFLERGNPDWIRIVTPSGGMELRDPSIAGDTLRGGDPSGGAPVRVPVAAVSIMQRRTLDGKRTTGAIVLGTLTAASVALMIAVATYDWDSY